MNQNKCWNCQSDGKKEMHCVNCDVNKKLCKCNAQRLEPYTCCKKCGATW